MGRFGSLLRGCGCLEPGEKRAAAPACSTGNMPGGRDAREQRSAELAAAGAADTPAESDLPEGAEKLDSALTFVEDRQATRQCDSEYMGEYGVTVRQFPSPDSKRKESLKQVARAEEPAEEAHFAGVRIL
ncbi:hypothetical protein KFL_001190180 [Klebsormidium nitens]|uniref:Uncharacterized protein n=1 Tax=Klebsormidium nitens TaxID=105231 RepID=A0A0U9HS53_KLENI|nr:hypothetical protein KFL_001190180 [Klebsormidium nitens]|eukprot:GAQ82675.1 hypothetical protein KFL_001190180 [Klebsormidium nitens]